MTLSFSILSFSMTDEKIYFDLNSMCLKQLQCEIFPAEIYELEWRAYAQVHINP